MMFGPKQFYLDLAASGQWDAVFELLDRRIINRDFCSHEGWGLLDYAYVQGNLEVTKILIQKYQVRNSPYAQAFLAAENNDWSYVFQLLNSQKIIHINSRNIRHASGWTLLDYALRNNKEGAQKLIAQGAEATMPVEINVTVKIHSPIVINPNKDPIAYVTFMKNIFSRTPSLSSAAATAAPPSIPASSTVQTVEKTNGKPRSTI